MKKKSLLLMECKEAVFILKTMMKIGNVKLGLNFGVLMQALNYYIGC